MTHNKKALAMAVATSILLWGCGQPQQAETKAAAPAAKQEAAKPLSKADVKLAPVQELVKGNGAEPATLDPAKTEGTVESNIQRDLYEGLVTTGPNGEIRPGVAERWESKDNKVYTFYLRKDAKWSNGDPVTAGHAALDQRGSGPAAFAPQLGKGEARAPFDQRERIGPAARGSLGGVRDGGGQGVHAAPMLAGPK